MRVRLGELAVLLDAELLGDPDLEVERISALDSADGRAISFFSNPRYQAQLEATLAGCVIVGPAQRDAALARTERQPGAATLICQDPYLALARLTQWWAARLRPAALPGVHASAIIEEGAWIAPSASIGPWVFVGRGARVGEGAVIGCHGYLGAEAWIGAGTVLKPQVTVNDACRVGQRGILHSGVVIGADGFGFAPSQGQWVKIEQLGAVQIGDDVEIGANTCVDRGAFDDTVLEDGVKLDNLVQIGHNVRVGAHSAFAGCVGVAGSARIGKHCTAGGGAIILGHLEIVDHVHITAATVVSRSIRLAGQYSGAFPFDDNASWEKNAATLRQLHSLRERLKALERLARETNK